MVCASRPADASGRPLSGAQPVDEIRLADGSTLSWQQIVDRSVDVMPSATAGNDDLTLTPIGDYDLRPGRQ